VLCNNSDTSVSYTHLNSNIYIENAFYNRDAGGYLPRWVINKDAQDQPLVLARIKKWLEEGTKAYNKDK